MKFYIIKTTLMGTTMASLFTFEEAVSHGWIDTNGKPLDNEYGIKVQIFGFDTIKEAKEAFKYIHNGKENGYET